MIFLDTHSQGVKIVTAEGIRVRDKSCQVILASHFELELIDAV
jgi:hypothetical protein